MLRLLLFLFFVAVVASKHGAQWRGNIKEEWRGAQQRAFITGAACKFAFRPAADVGGNKGKEWKQVFACLMCASFTLARNVSIEQFQRVDPQRKKIEQCRLWGNRAEILDNVSRVQRSHAYDKILTREG